MQPDGDFMECYTCRKLPGAPVLCDGCLHNRRVIEEYRTKFPWLLRCEAALRSMAAQFIHPKVTAEEMVDTVLRVAPTREVPPVEPQ